MTHILEKIEEVKAELQQVVEQHNQLGEQKNAALQRFTELQGALKHYKNYRRLIHMAERTSDEVAAIFSAAGDSVTVINGNKAEGETDAEWKNKLQRNVDHLEIIKAYKKEDGTTSIWTSESFTAIDAAVTSGKSKIAAL